MTNAIYQTVTGVSKRTASRELNELVEQGILITGGGTRGRGKQYRLKDN